MLYLFIEIKFMLGYFTNSTDDKEIDLFKTYIK